MNVTIVLHLLCSVVLLAATTAQPFSTPLRYEEVRAAATASHAVAQFISECAGSKCVVKPGTQVFTAGRPVCQDRRGCVVINVCGLGNQPFPHYPPQHPQLDPYLLLATTTLELRGTLAASGYPPSAYSDALNRYESNELAIIARGSTPSDADPYYFAQEDFSVFGLLLTAAVAARGLRTLFFAAGCGGPSRDPNFDIRPSEGAKLYIASEVGYLLCKARHARLDSPTECPYWDRLSSTQNLANFSPGYYYYLVRWPDGASRVAFLDNEFTSASQTTVITHP